MSEERRWLPPKASGEEKVDKEKAAQWQKCRRKETQRNWRQGRPRGGLGGRKGEDARGHCQLEERPEAGGEGGAPGPDRRGAGAA